MQNTPHPSHHHSACLEKQVSPTTWGFFNGKVRCPPCCAPLCVSCFSARKAPQDAQPHGKFDGGPDSIERLTYRPTFERREIHTPQPSVEAHRSDHHPPWSLSRRVKGRQSTPDAADQIICRRRRYHCSLRSDRRRSGHRRCTARIDRLTLQANQPNHTHITPHA